MLFSILKAIAFFLPLALVYGAGIVIALIRKDRHPRVSLLAALGCALFLVAGLSQLFVQIVVPHLGIGYGAIGWIFSISRIFHTMLEMVGFGLLLGAAFGMRDEPARTA